MNAAATLGAADVMWESPRERGRPRHAPVGRSAGDEALFDALRDLDARGAAGDADQAGYRQAFLLAVQRHLGLSIAQIWSLADTQPVSGIRCVASVSADGSHHADLSGVLPDESGMVVQSFKRFGMYSCDDIADEPVLGAMARAGILGQGSLLSLAISINGHVCSALTVQRDRKADAWSRGDLAALRRAAVLYALRASRWARSSRLLDSDRESGVQCECCCAA